MSDNLPALSQQFDVLHRPRFGGGEQILARFPNGYGVSVIRGQHTYGGDTGLWEVAVIRFTGKAWDDFELTYDTPITNDVMGWLTEKQVTEVAQAVNALPEDHPAPPSHSGPGEADAGALSAAGAPVAAGAPANPEADLYAPPYAYRAVPRHEVHPGRRWAW